MFGVSFPELLVLSTVALLVLGPDKLPGMLRTLGQWLTKLRRLTTEVRHQSGIDDVLRAEGFDGGLNELRSIMRGGVASPSPRSVVYSSPAAGEPFAGDKSREYPTEGPDSYGALAEDLLPGALPPAVSESAPAGQLPTTDASPANESAPAAAPTSAAPGAAEVPDSLQVTRETDG